MAKVLSKCVLRIGQGVAPDVLPAADTFDTIGNLTGIDGPQIAKADVEHTDMDSTSKEYFGDLKDNGNLNFTCRRNFGNAGQTAARDDAQQNVLRNFELERLDPADDTVLETASFVGEVMEWNENAPDRSSPFDISGRIKITGDITYA